MFVDPQVVTINSVAKSMALVNSEGTKRTYQTNDKSFTLIVSHQSSVNNAKSKGLRQRVRTLIRLEQRATVADPLSAENDYDEMTIQMVIDRPEAGFTAQQLQYLVAGFEGWLDSTAVTKLFGRES